MKLPTKKAFKEWLESKDPGAIVGEAARAGSCPLAKFEKETTDRCWSAGVTPYYIRVNNSKLLVPENHWIERFVIEVDKDRESFTGVTAEEALEALRAISRTKHVQPR